MDLTEEQTKRIDEAVGSKETTDFIKALNSEDTMGVLIRGHLYLEAVLLRLIGEALEEPGAIELDALRFPVKVDLAIALSAIPTYLRSPLISLNTLRNKVAHNVSVLITDSDQRNLFNRLSKKDRQATMKMMESKKFSQLLPACIARLYVLLLTLEVIGKISRGASEPE